MLLLLSTKVGKYVRFVCLFGGGFSISIFLFARNDLIVKGGYSMTSKFKIKSQTDSFFLVNVVVMAVDRIL